MAALPEEQVAEIKKIFSVFDKDGDGTISSKELGTVISQLTGGQSNASEQELASLMTKMDANRDGAISWDEFLGSLTAWLKEEDEVKSDARGRKRKADDAESSTSSLRTKIHRQISSFFLQFKRATNFEQIREKYLKQSQQAKDGDEDLSMEARDNQMASSYDKAPTAQEKADALTLSRQLLDHLPQIALGINGQDPSLAHKCTQGLANLLAVCEKFPTPEERYEIADFLVPIFLRVHEAGVLTRIIQFLTVEKRPDLQYEAARVITYYGPGPRIAHTPTDSILHPSKMMHKSEIIHKGGLHNLCKLLLSSCAEVREQAVVAVGRLASFDHEVRDLLLNMGVYKVLFSQITDATQPSLLYKITWALSIFCGHSHSLSHPPKYDIVAAALPKFAYLFTKNDEHVLVNVCNALAFLLPGISIDDTFCQRFIQLLGHTSSRVVRVVMSVLHDLCRLQSDLLKRLLHAHLLKALREVLKNNSNASIRLDACDLVLLIAGEKGEIQAVIDDGLVPVLLELLNKDDMLRSKVVKVLSYLSRGVPSQLSYLVEQQDAVRALTSALQHFKNYDTVLRDLYNFLGPSYNFRFVHDVALTLENLLRAGESSPGANPYVKYFDMECVDRIKSVMMVCGGELADQMDAWRSVEGVEGKTLESMLVDLIQTIKLSHDKAKSSVSAHISTQCTETIKQFQAAIKKNAANVKQRRAQKQQESKQPASSPTAMQGVASAPGATSPTSAALSLSRDTKQITIKCYFDGDNRLLENLHRNISLKDLTLRAQLKYGRQLVLQYEDEDGDKITIDSPQLLEKALSQFDVSGQYKLYLLPSKTPVSSVSSSQFTISEGSRTASSLHLFDHFTEVKQSKAGVINELAFETKLSKSDLERLYTQFHKTAKKGLLNKEQFEKGFKSVSGPNVDAVMIDQFFNAFDYDKDGFVDFRDFACGLSVLHKGSTEERLHLAFKAYDLDGNGSIDNEELFHILKSSFRAKGFEQSDDSIRLLVQQCFEQADLDGNGTLDYEEFKSAVLQHQIVVQSFWKS